MFKKIALAAALVSSAAFATWDYYPVLEGGKGSAKGNLYYDWDHDWSQAGLGVGARFSVINGLEISLQDWGYQFWGEWDCSGCVNGGSGLRDLTIGARYQFMPVLIAALDVNLPLTSKDVTGDYDPFGLYGAIQFTKEFVPNLWFGSEAGVSYKFEDEHMTEGLGLTLQVELDYTIASIGLTPWIGAEMDMRISDVEVEVAGVKSKYGSGDNAFLVWIGAGYDITPMFTVKANFIMKFADEKESMGGDWKGVNAKLAINF